MVKLFQLITNGRRRRTLIISCALFLAVVLSVLGGVLLPYLAQARTPGWTPDQDNCSQLSPHINPAINKGAAFGRDIGHWSWDNGQHFIVACNNYAPVGDPPVATDVALTHAHTEAWSGDAYRRGGYGAAFQCVELVMRYAYARWGDVPGDWGGDAGRNWAHHPDHLHQFPRGTNALPVPGDIFVWDSHIDILIALDSKTKIATTFDENFLWNTLDSAINSFSYSTTNGFNLAGNGGKSDASFYGWLHSSENSGVGSIWHGPRGTGSGGTPPYLATRPVVITNAQGNPEVYARGTDNHIWHSSIQESGVPIAWDMIGDATALADTPAPFTTGQVYARGADDNLIKQTTYNTSTGQWSPWTAIGNIPPKTGFVGDPTVIAPNTALYPTAQAGTPLVYAVGNDGRLYSTYVSTTSGTWTNWQAIQTSNRQAPLLTGNITFTPSGLIYARDVHGTMLQAALTAKGWLWSTVGRTPPRAGFAGDPSLSVIDSTLYPTANTSYPVVYAIGNDGRLYHTYVDAASGQWTKWQPLLASNGPTPVLTGTAAPFLASLIYARDTANMIEQLSYSAGTWSWKIIGTSFPTAGFASDPITVMGSSSRASTSYPTVFAIGSDGHLDYTFVGTLANDWAVWQRVGNNLPYFNGTYTPPTPAPTARPTVATNVLGAPEIYLRGADEHIWHSPMQENGAPVVWEQVGDDIALAGNPAPFTTKQIFARGDDNTIKQAYFNVIANQWEGWTTIGANPPTSGFTGDPSVIATNTVLYPDAQQGTPDVFASSKDGHLYHSYKSTVTGTWTDWLPVAASTGQPPTLAGAVTLFADNLLYARDTQNTIKQASYRAGGWIWSIVGAAPTGGLAGDPAAIAVDKTHYHDANPSFPDIYVTGSDGRLYHSYMSHGAWTDWLPILTNGSQSPSLIGAVALFTPALLYVRSTDGTIQQASLTLSGWIWQAIGTAPPAGGFAIDPVAASDTDGTTGLIYPEIFTVGADGHLAYTSLQMADKTWAAWRPLGNPSIDFR